MRCVVNTVNISYRRRWPVLLAFVTACGSVTAARGAEEEQSNSEWLSLYNLDAYLEFEGEWTSTKVEQDRRRLGGQRSQKNRDWILKERVGLQLSGAIVDPSLITFSGDVSFALTQSRYKEEIDGFDQSDRDYGHLLQYDLRLNLFRGKKLSGTVYGLRQDDRINRRFQPTLDQRRTGVGTNWIFADDTFPMELSYDYLETDRTGNRREQDDEHYTESTLHYGVDWNISKSQKVKFSYDHSRTDQNFQGLDLDFATDRDVLRLEHELRFGPEDRNELRTVVRWQEEEGDFARDLFQVGPQLTLHHSDTLQTSYKYQFDRERYEGLDIATHRADFQLVHQLYSNLTTTVDVFGLYEDIEDDVNTTQYGASVDWQYNRKNDYGRLFANLALAYDREETDGDNGNRIILDEAHAFRDPLAITLRNRNVVAESIVVTDPTNRRFYRLGVDYTIVQFSNVTQLGRIQTGAINDGDAVLVDYQFRTPADGKLDTVRVDFNLEQRFSNGLTPFYRFSYRNQEDNTSAGYDRRADRTDHHRMGVDYRQDRYSLGAEYEIFDDSVDPYNAYHLRGMLHVVNNPNNNVNLSTRLSHLFFEGGYDDRNVIMLDVELDHRWRMTECLSTIERVAYRLQNDSVDGRTNAWDVTAGLEYNVGDFFSEFTFEYDRLDLPESEEDDFGVFVRVRREFSNVLAMR